MLTQLLVFTGAAFVLLAGCADSAEPNKKKKTVAVGDVAPDFTLKTGKGEEVTLSKCRGSVVVVFFYPKDNTSICTKEVCAFRDSFEVFEENGAKLFGISSDSVDSHKGFGESQQLNFPLLSDAGGKIRKLYKVPKTFGVIPGRVTYVIDKKGVIQHLFNSQKNAQKHVDEALKVVKRLHAEDDTKDKK